MSGGPQFAPQTNSTPGAPISAALLNGLVQAQGYVQSGGVPPTSASLIVTMPSTAAVVPIAGGLSAWVGMASGALPALTASNDSYIDLVSTTTYPYTGSYVVASVANGAAAPAVAANGLRLCKVVTSGTAATAVTPLALPTPFGSRAGPTSIPLVGQGVALPYTGIFADIPGGTESYSFTTLQAHDRVVIRFQAKVINAITNPVGGEVKFILVVTAVPGGSAVPLAGIAPQFGVVPNGQTVFLDHATEFAADIAGTYTVKPQYVWSTSGSPAGSVTYNAVSSFGGVSAYHGAITFSELLG